MANMTQRSRRTQVIVGHGTTAAGRLLGWSDQTIRNKIRRGELRALQTSTGQFIVTDEEIEREIERRKQTAAAIA